MRLRVRVPATTANVGSGFDCVGIAVTWYDELVLETNDSGELVLDVTGEGADSIPRDRSHLVIKTMLDSLERMGVPAPSGMTLSSHNTIPHSRGVGSSAAAIVAGLAFADAIAHPDEEIDLQQIAHWASVIEGHPDNAVAATMGGAVLAWMIDEHVETVSIPCSQEVSTMVWTPQFEVPTAGARSTLPELVPRQDAVDQAIAAASLPIALTSRPDLLWFATTDRLHQEYRKALMPSSYDLMCELRDHGVPATISGAGPSVFAVGTAQQLTIARHVRPQGFMVRALGIGTGVSLTREVW